MKIKKRNDSTKSSSVFHGFGMLQLISVQVNQPGRGSLKSIINKSPLIRHYAKTAIHPVRLREKKPISRPGDRPKLPYMDLPEERRQLQLISISSVLPGQTRQHCWLLLKLSLVNLKAG